MKGTALLVREVFQGSRYLCLSLLSVPGCSLMPHHFCSYSRSHNHVAMNSPGNGAWVAPYSLQKVLSSQSQTLKHNCLCSCQLGLCVTGDQCLRYQPCHLMLLCFVCCKLPCSDLWNLTVSFCTVWSWASQPSCQPKSCLQGLFWSPLTPCHPLGQGLASFFSEEPDNKYLKLWSHIRFPLHILPCAFFSFNNL